MDYIVNYAKIKHGYVRIGSDGVLKLSIPIRLKSDKNFENILLEKGKKLLDKISKKNYQIIESFGEGFIVIFGEKVLLNGCKISENELKQKLYDVSLPILEKYSKYLGIPFQKLSIKSLKSKRGSCSHNQKIVLNLKLIHLPLQFLEYVIIHEVCHLKEKNHSHRFWKLVGDFCPEYKEIRKGLKNHRI